MLQILVQLSSISNFSEFSQYLLEHIRVESKYDVPKYHGCTYLEYFNGLQAEVLDSYTRELFYMFLGNLAIDGAAAVKLIY